MSLRNNIRTMAGKQVVIMIKGIVTAVDKDTDTMTLSPLDGSADYTGVLLEALDKTDDTESDVVRYPAIGAFAIIGLIDNNDLNTFLIKASQFESVTILIAKSVKITASGNGNVTIDANSIVFNDGNNSGLVNIQPLVTKINKLETVLNQQITAFKTHTHSGVTTGPGISGLSIIPAPSLITPLTKQSELEDTSITH
jgi:hypothetical protein